MGWIVSFVCLENWNNYFGKIEYLIYDIIDDVRIWGKKLFWKYFEFCKLFLNYYGVFFDVFLLMKVFWLFFKVYWLRCSVLNERWGLFLILFFFKGNDFVY